MISVKKIFLLFSFLVFSMALHDGENNQFGRFTDRFNQGARLFSMIRYRNNRTRQDLY